MANRKCKALAFSKLFVLFLFGTVFFSSCKKSNSKSDSKGISSFNIYPQGIAGIFGEIKGDSIYLPVPQSTSLVNVTPSITYVGVSISPGQNVAQNFNNPVTYTVMAADGTTVSYVVVPKVLSDSKAINSFIFKAANNPGLSSDLTGIIVGDTIVVYGDSAVASNELIPTITYTGVKINPDSGVKEDFSNPVYYNVTAMDGTVKTYTVMYSVDKRLYVGSDDGYLYALDAAAGTLLWKYKTGGSIRSSPTYYNGMVYFLSGDAYFYALNAADGSLKWRYLAPYDGRNESTSSSPTGYLGIVYVNSQCYLNAFDATTGSIIWQSYIGVYSSGGSPTVVNGVVYYSPFAWNGTVVSFNASNGSNLLNYPGGTGQGNPTMVNGIVYSQDETAILAARDIQTAVLKWVLNLTTQTPAGETVPLGTGTAPTYYNGKLYVGGAAGLLALDPNNGSILWQTYNEESDNSSIATAGEGLVFAFSHFGAFKAFDANTGAVKWTVSINNSNSKYNESTQATYSNGTLYVGTADGYVCAFNALTGQMKWSILTGGPVYSGSCIVDAGANVHHPTISGDQQ